jgi:hypothetical protein
MLIDEALDASLSIVLRRVEPALDRARYANAGIRHARTEDLEELVEIHLGAGSLEIGEVGLLNLGGVAHAPILRAKLVA